MKDLVSGCPPVPVTWPHGAVASHTPSLVALPGPTATLCPGGGSAPRPEVMPALGETSGDTPGLVLTALSHRGSVSEEIQACLITDEEEEEDS